MPPCSVRASVFAKRRSAVTRCASIPWARQHLVEAASTAWRPGRSTWLPSDVPRPVRRDDQRLARGRGGSAQTQGRQCRRAGIRVRSCSRSAGRPWILGTLCEPRSRRGDRVAESSVKRKRARSGDVSPPWARPLYGIPQECRMQCTQMAVTLGPSDWRTRCRPDRSRMRGYATRRYAYFAGGVRFLARDQGEAPRVLSPRHQCSRDMYDRGNHRIGDIEQGAASSNAGHARPRIRPGKLAPWHPTRLAPPVEPFPRSCCHDENRTQHRERPCRRYPTAVAPRRESCGPRLGHAIDLRVWGACPGLGALDRSASGRAARRYRA